MLLVRTIVCGIFIFGLCGPAAASDKEVMKIYEQGVEANKKGELDEAIRLYSKAISMKPDSASLFFVRGRAYSQKNQLDNSISDLTRAISLKPGYAEAYNHRGVAYIGKGQKPQAMADFRKSCELGSQYGCANVQKLTGMK